MSPTDGYEVWMTFQGFELWPQSKSPRHSMLSSQHMFPSLFVFIFLTEYVSTTISFLHLPWQLWLGRMWRYFVYICSAASYATYLSQLLRCLAAVAFSWKQRVHSDLGKHGAADRRNSRTRTQKEPSSKSRVLWAPGDGNAGIRKAPETSVPLPQVLPWNLPFVAGS